ncbi:hypothetical protein AU508_06305 [Lonsdalea populi]|nr:hypothetical protein AU508_06305 [Lonsdalea populi]
MKNMLVMALLLGLHAASFAQYEFAAPETTPHSLAQEITREEQLLRTLREKAEHGSEEDRHQLTDRLLHSNWPPYRAEGIEWLKQEADANDARAQFRLSKIYLGRMPNENDPESGLIYLKKVGRSRFRSRANTDVCRVEQAPAVAERFRASQTVGWKSLKQPRRHATVERGRRQYDRLH